MTSFKEKYGPWALITGASEGTGSAFAHRLADYGINRILVARRAAPLVEMSDAIRAKDVECVTASIDLSKLDATAQILTAVGDREVGFFIANAGGDSSARFLEREIDDWDGLVGLNIL